MSKTPLISTPDIRQIQANETFVVRHPVLRAGKPLESCHFEGDELSTTKHFGLFLENKIVAVVSIFKSDSSFFKKSKQYQLRGMAVLEQHQKNGYGEALLRH